jgi:hypothetical protein
LKEYEGIHVACISGSAMQTICGCRKS